MMNIVSFDLGHKMERTLAGQVALSWSSKSNFTNIEQKTFMTIGVKIRSIPFFYSKNWEKIDKEKVRFDLAWRNIVSQQDKRVNDPRKLVMLRARKMFPHVIESLSFQEEKELFASEKDRIHKSIIVDNWIRNGKKFKKNGLVNFNPSHEAPMKKEIVDALFTIDHASLIDELVSNAHRLKEDDVKKLKKIVMKGKSSKRIVDLLANFSNHGLSF